MAVDSWYVSLTHCWALLIFSTTVFCILRGKRKKWWWQHNWLVENVVLIEYQKLGNERQGRGLKEQGEVTVLKQNLCTLCRAISVCNPLQKLSTKFTIQWVEIKVIRQWDIKAIFWLYMWINLQLISNSWHVCFCSPEEAICQDLLLKPVSLYGTWAFKSSSGTLFGVSVFWSSTSAAGSEHCFHLHTTLSNLTDGNFSKVMLSSSGQEEL